MPKRPWQQRQHQWKGLETRQMCLEPPCVFFISFYFLYYTYIFFRSGDGSSNSGRGSRLGCSLPLYDLFFSPEFIDYMRIYSPPRAPNSLSPTSFRLENLWRTWNPRNEGKGLGCKYFACIGYHFVVSNPLFKFFSHVSIAFDSAKSCFALLPVLGVYYIWYCVSRTVALLTWLGMYIKLIASEMWN